MNLSTNSTKVVQKSSTPCYFSPYYINHEELIKITRYYLLLLLSHLLISNMLKNFEF